MATVCRMAEAVNVVERILEETKQVDVKPGSEEADQVIADVTAALTTLSKIGAQVDAAGCPVDPRVSRGWIRVSAHRLVGVIQPPLCDQKREQALVIALAHDLIGAGLWKASDTTGALPLVLEPLWVLLHPTGSRLPEAIGLACTQHALKEVDPPLLRMLAATGGASISPAELRVAFQNVLSTSRQPDARTLQVQVQQLHAVLAAIPAFILWKQDWRAVVLTNEVRRCVSVGRLDTARRASLKAVFVHVASHLRSLAAADESGYLAIEDHDLQGYICNVGLVLLQRSNLSVFTEAAPLFFTILQPYMRLLRPYLMRWLNYLLTHATAITLHELRGWDGPVHEHVSVLLQCIGAHLPRSWEIVDVFASGLFRTFDGRANMSVHTLHTQLQSIGRIFRLLLRYGFPVHPATLINWVTTASALGVTDEIAEALLSSGVDIETPTLYVKFTDDPICCIAYQRSEVEDAVTLRAVNHSPLLTLCERRLVNKPFSVLQVLQVLREGQMFVSYVLYTSPHMYLGMGDLRAQFCVGATPLHYGPSRRVLGSTYNPWGQLDSYALFSRTETLFHWTHPQDIYPPSADTQAVAKILYSTHPYDAGPNGVTPDQRLEWDDSPRDARHVMGVCTGPPVSACQYSEVFAAAAEEELRWDARGTLPMLRHLRTVAQITEGEKGAVCVSAPDGRVRDREVHTARGGVRPPSKRPSV